jgi:hypothetical protein
MIAAPLANDSLEQTGRPTALPRPELRPGRPAAQLKRYADSIVSQQCIRVIPQRFSFISSIVPIWRGGQVMTSSADRLIVTCRLTREPSIRPISLSRSNN